jgi:molybdopterin synthase sulfur carrier subunit
MIRVLLHYHLRTLARVDSEVLLEVKSAPTLGSVLDALEARYPVLRGTIRDTDYRAAPAFRQILRLQRRSVTSSA